MAPRIMQRGPPPISAAPSRITPIIHLTYICRIFLPPFISAALFEVSLFSQAGVPFAFSCFFFLSVSYRKGGCRAQMSANGIFLSANGSVSVQLAEIPKEKGTVSQIPCQTAPCLILPLSHSRSFSCSSSLPDLISLQDRVATARKTRFSAETLTVPSYFSAAFCALFNPHP